MTLALRAWLTVAGLLGLAAVVLGAYGAHALKGVDPALLQRFDTALRFHLVHVLALLGAVVLALWGDSLALRGVRWAFLGGLALFCGSLYASSLTGGETGTRFAPLGGGLFMLGWLGLAVHAWLAPGVD